MDTVLGIREEDYLDWLENAARTPADVLLADAAVLAGCFVLVSALVATAWLTRLSRL